MTAVHMHENTGTHKRKSSRETKNTVKHSPPPVILNTADIPTENCTIFSLGANEIHLHL